MTYSKLDVWDWLALALLLVCAVYVGVLIILLHHWRDTFDLVQGWVDGLPFSPNRLLPFAYAPRELAPPGYLVTRQVNLLLAPLVGYYLVFRIRADTIGREPISGLDLLFGVASILLLPLLIVVANHLPETSATALLGDRVVRAFYAFTSSNSVGGAAYLLGCVILINGITYLPAYVISRLFGRIKRRFRARRRRAEDRPGLGTIARAQWVSDIERDPNALTLIRDAADAAIVEETATELLRGLVVTTGLPASLMSGLFEQFSEQSRLRSTTTGSWPVDAPYGHGVVAFLGAIAEQNIAPAQVNEVSPGRKVSFVASIPSSPSSWEGVLMFDLEGSGWRYRVDAKVIFPGQLFAWGRGKRILSKLERDMGEYLTELAQRRV